MVECNLEVWSEINPFLHYIAFGHSAYHSNRNQAIQDHAGEDRAYGRPCHELGSRGAWEWRGWGQTLEWPGLECRIAKKRRGWAAMGEFSVRRGTGLLAMAVAGTLQQCLCSYKSTLKCFPKWSPKNPHGEAAWSNTVQIWHMPRLPLWYNSYALSVALFYDKGKQPSTCYPGRWAYFLLAVIHRGLGSPGSWNAASYPSCFSRPRRGRKCWNHSSWERRPLGSWCWPLSTVSAEKAELRRGGACFTLLMAFQEFTPKIQHHSRRDMNLVAGSHLDDGLGHLWSSQWQFEKDTFQRLLPPEVS